MPKCPRCGDPKAEIGFSRCYCPNDECLNFDQKRQDEVVAEAEEAFEEAAKQLTFDYPDWYFGDDYVSH